MSAEILVVEDERIVAKDLQATLQRLGYMVPVIATSGEEAVKQALLRKPQLLLMDIVLRGAMDGIEAARAIRAQHDVPVIYLSAYVDDATVTRAKTTEPAAYLVKPFREDELHAAIQTALTPRPNGPLATA